MKVETILRWIAEEVDAGREISASLISRAWPGVSVTGARALLAEDWDRFRYVAPVVAPPPPPAPAPRRCPMPACGRVAPIEYDELGIRTPTCIVHGPQYGRRAPTREDCAEVEGPPEGRQRRKGASHAGARL